MRKFYLTTTGKMNVNNNYSVKKRLSFLLMPLLFFVAIAFTTNLNAQTAAQYSFSASNGGYSEISGDPILIDNGNSDDGFANGFPIGFDFTFGGVTYNEFNVSTNGWITLGNNGDNNITNSGLTNNFAAIPKSPLIAALWDDNEISDLGRDITFKSAGGVLTIQFTNVQWRYLATVAEAAINFQIKLYESTGAIEFVYDPINGGVLNTPSASIGIATANGVFLSVNGTGATPTASSSTSTNNLSALPARGQTYTFNPPPPCSGTPNPGRTFASVNSVCASSGATTTLSFETFALGTTYLWQQSTDGGATWQTVSGTATTATYVATPTATTQYRCRVTCTSSGASGTSNPTTVIYDNTCIVMPVNGDITTCSATFYDAGGPTANYAANEVRQLTINPSTTGANVKVVFNSFNTENGYDGLMIYNGRDANPANLISSGLAAGFNATTAPAGSFYGTTSPGTITSTDPTGSLTFVFRSDNIIQSTGWNATVSCILPCDATPTPGATLATSTFVCNGFTTTLSLTNNNFAGVTYQWQSSVDNSSWSDITGATSSTFTASPTSNVFFRCKVTCTAAPAVPGFSTSIQIETSACDEVLMPSNGTTLISNTCSALFTDEGGTRANYSTLNATGTVTFRPGTAGTKIRATFTSFSTENNYDGLMIYNGNSTGSPLLSSGLPAGLNATTAPAGSYYGNNSPGVVSSTAADGSLTFVFKTDGSQSAAGWVATISCYVDNSCTGTPIPGNTVATNTTVCYGGTTTLSTSNTINATNILYQWQSSPNGTAWTDITDATSTTYVVSSLTASTFYRATVRCTSAGGGVSSSTQLQVLVDQSCINMPTNATLATCNASFYDNGGASANYTENQNRTFTVTPTTAGSVNGPFSRVTFTNFALDPSDTLKVYDGTNTSVLLGAYTTNPGAITSSNTSNGGLTFVFKSNATLNAAGWAGTIICYTPPSCNTAPPLGTVLASIDTVCSGGSTNLSLSNAATLPGGLSYQWKSSSDGTTYNNIAGASNLPTYSPTNITTTTWYQCVVTCSGFGTTTFTAIKVLVTPTPVLTVSSATNVCGSGAVLLTASSSVSGVTIRWYSNAAGTTLVGTGATYTTPVISTNTTYYVKANYGDCESNLIPIVAIINPFPSNVVINPQADTICVSPNTDSLRISGGLFVDGSQAQITWSPATYLYRDAAATIPYTLGANAPTVYIKSTAPNATIIDYIATAGTTCTKLDTTRITYRDATPSVTIAIIRPTGAICPSDTITFRATPVNGGNAGPQAPSYKFFVNDVAVTSNYNTSDTIRFPGSLTSIRLNDADVVQCVMLVNPFTINCASSNQFVSNSEEVTVNSVNRDSVLLNASATSICTGSSVTFTAVPQAFPGDTPEYEFLVNGSVVRNRNTVATYTTSLLTNGQVVTVRMYSNQPCVIPVPAVSLPKTITVTPFTPISVTLNSSVGTTSCTGVNVTFSAVPSNRTTTSTYQFFKNNVSVQGPSTDSTYDYIPANGDQIKVVFVSNFSACTTNDPDTSSTITMTVGNSTVSSVTLTPSTAICNGVLKTFTANPTGGGTAPLYEFFVDGSSVQGPSTTATYSRTATANYNIEVRMTPDGCGLPNPATATLTQVVNPTPQGSLSANTICTGGTGQLTYTATSGTGPYTLVVNGVTYNNIVSGTAFNASLNPTTTTNYTLTSVTDANGCNRSSSFTNASATITVNTPPVVSITNNSSGATVLTCTQTQILLAASPSGAGYSLLWTNGSTNANQVITTPGTYSVTVTQTSTTCSATSANVVITQNANEPTGAGLSGIYYIPSGGASCRNFASIKNAVDTLNKFGVLGNVTINVAAGYTETLTRRLDLGSITLNANTALGRTITFKKFGSGANPLITAYTGTTLSTNQTPDGMWSLSGVDNVTIDGIDLVDANTASPTTMMEYGYGLFKGYDTTSLTATNSASTTVIVRNTSRITVGASVSVISGTGSFAGNTTVTSITNATTFVVSLSPSTISAGAVIAFSTLNDGAQNNTIKNCVITLNKANNNAGSTPVFIGSVGIAAYNSIANAATTPLVPSTIDGGNSRNKFYTNTISNCSNGIGLSGWNALSTNGTFGRDTLNDIGGSTLATGNTITNFGGSGLTNDVSGIRLRGQFDVNASYNTINNNNGATANPSGGLVRGIYGETGVSADTTIITYNNITINNGSLQNAIGIDNTIGTGILNGNGVNISNNTITGTNGNLNPATGSLFAINNSASVANLNISNNTIQDMSMTGGGEWRGIYNTQTCNSVIINGNLIQNNNLNNSTSTATPTNYIYSASLITTSLSATFNNNQILNNSKACGVASAFAVYGINFQGASGCSVTMNNNTISKDSILHTGTNTVETAGLTLGGLSTYSLDNNIISNIGININAASTSIMTVSGIRSNNNSTSENFTNNTINQLYLKGSSTSTALNLINGIWTNSGSSTKTFTNNVINTLYANAGYSASIVAIRNNSGLAVNISKNKIYGLYPGQSATLGSIAKGISLASLSTNGVANVYNNFISIDLTTGVPSGASGTAINTGAFNTDGIRGIETSPSVALACSANIYNNSIRLAGSGTTFFASSGIQQTNLSNATYMTLTLKGNIISNQCTSVGGGIVASFKRNAVALTNYSTSSNYNSFFAGTASATNLLYYDGTNSEQTIAGLRTRLGAEGGSISALPSFVAPATGDLHITACVGNNSSFENVVVGTPLFNTDYDGDTRLDPSDIGADEISSGAGKVNTDASVCSGSNGATLTLTGSVGVTSITRWEQSIDGGTNWNTIANTTTSYTYSNLTQTTLYRAIVNTVACSNVPSGAATITVNSAPSITTPPSTTAQNTCLNSAFSTPTVSVVTSAGSPTYQWYSNTTNNNTGGSLIASATAASYTLPNTVAGTTYYYCIVTSGVCPSTSDVSAAMTVNALPTITLTNGIADSVCFSTSAQNSTLAFSGTTNGANQYSITWVSTFANVTNATLPSSPITIVVPASATANTTFTGNISVRNSTTGCSSASSTSFTIKVKSIVIITNPVTANLTTCLNSAFTGTTTLSATSSSPSPTYQWFSNTLNSNVGGTNLGSANGAQTATYTPQSNAVGALYYYAVITSNGCTSTTNPSGLWSVTTGPTSGALSGTYYIPTTVLSDCKVFSTIAAAVTYLNANGISASVVFKVAPGYTETLTNTLALGSATLNNTTSTKTIRFEKNGAGTNPLITAFTGGAATSASTTPDGIWSLRGVDYVTIDGIDIRENASNTTAASQMEYGYGLFKLGVADGAQNDTIKNCTITLNKNNTTLSTNFFNGATGIAMTNATAIDANTLLTPTNVTGANSNNTFISNTISNVNVGIGLIGFAANDQATFADVNNLVGDTITSSKGNSITNLGGGTTSNNTEVSTGVLLKNQLNALVGYNIITGAGHNEDQYGVRSDNTTGTGSIVIKQNNISITGAADKKYAGIENNTGGGTSSIINITNNTLNVKIPNTVTTTVAASVTGIKNGSTLAPGTINISNNTFTNSTIAGAGKWIGIYNTTNVTALTGVINMSNNTITGNSILATGTFNGLQSDANTYGTQTINTNTISNNSKTITGVTELSWLSQKPSGVGNCGNLNIQYNNIENNDVLVASGNAIGVNVYGVFSGGSKAGATFSFSANTIRKISLKDINSTNIGKLWGLNTNSTLGTATTETIADNKISNLFITAAAGSSATHTIAGMQLGGATSTTTVRNVFQNRIDSFYVRNNNDATAYNSTVTGIYIPAGSGVTSMYTNRVAHLVPFGSAAGIARGFWLGTSPSSGTPVSIYNNMIEMDMSQAFDGASATSLNNSDAVRGIDITGGVAGTPYNISFNTIRIGGTGGSSFGTTVVDMNINNPTYTFRNNVFVNKATPGASGNVAILRAVASQLSVGTKYSTSSSNNAYYAGVASSSNYLFTDGSNNFQTLASLQASSRELNSVENVDPLFARSSDNQDSLHMNGTLNCAFNGTGIDVSGISTDIDGTTRLSPPDMGADEFNTTGGGIGQWAGVNTNWNDGANWCGVLPTANTNVTIANGKPNYPTIDNTTTPVAYAKDLTIGSTATVKILSGGKLNIYGNITNAGSGNVDAKLGTIEMAGATAQTIPANLFGNNNLRNLVINNSSVTLAGQLNLLNKLSFTGSTRTFATGSFLTLKSTDTLTASVADITNGGNSTGNSITGNVSVERFISNIKNSTPTLKAWRLLSMPTTHNLQTIKQAWQENGDSTTVFNPNPGFGAQIITRFGGTNAAARALGFDSYNANGGSLKTLNISTQAWEEVSTTNAAFDAQKPYVVFIRGSRAKTLFTDVPDVTVMRERGSLNLGDFPISNLPTSANKFASIVNPYASAIRLPATRSGFKTFYYLYDPRIGVNGGWITIAQDGTSAYNGGSYTNGNFNIQSAQGFIMETNAGNPSMTIKETDKVDGSASVQRENRNQQKFYTRLYKVQNGTADLYDGVLNRFDEGYSNEVDDEDGTKFTNTTENFAIVKNDKLISIESRKALTENDTIFYKMNQMRVANYRFEFIPENIESFNLQAYLEDKFTNTLTPVSLSEKTVFDFVISNNSGAYASDRFRIIFKPLRPLPVTFVDVKAIKQKEQINVNWKVENEINIREYAVEKSNKGINFVKIGTVLASGITDYAHVDESPFAGVNFYRIRSVGVTGEVGYSKIVKVSYEAVPMISIYPNPIKSDRKATISFKNVNAGRYTLKLTNNLGQVLMRKVIQHDGVTSQYDFTLSKSVINGSYTLEIIGQDNKKTSLKILF